MSETYISIDHLSKKYDKDFVLKDVKALQRAGPETHPCKSAPS